MQKLPRAADRKYEWRMRKKEASRQKKETPVSVFMRYAG